MAARLSSREHYASLLGKYDTWLFDCDGVLWKGDELIDGATDVLQLLRHHSTFLIVAQISLVGVIMRTFVSKTSRCCSSQTTRPSRARATRRSLTRSGLRLTSYVSLQGDQEG